MLIVENKLNKTKYIKIRAKFSTESLGDLLYAVMLDFYNRYETTYENPLGFSIQFVFAKLEAETRSEIVYKSVVAYLKINLSKMKKILNVISDSKNNINL
ncbi:hypothetical protein D1818_22065 [Aquimarina sp. BL5]|uniref:hypothetical protein n=1 Tax=Aquimarina sp. BL5 TaxID=1714860 RepID=UPI000E53F5E6|nr:hypothetical protein [Aquimarina sp. BL5]AXT53381.1 hypothetical protein D1818_22065 [Aquimarina sp. BL5]RKN00498.1 hypothetical protein D7036_18660 [Aquimarina sp. BL5]